MGVYRIQWISRSGREKTDYIQAPDGEVAIEALHDREHPWIDGIIACKRMDDLDDAPVQQLPSVRPGQPFMVPGDPLSRVLVSYNGVWDAVTGEPVRLEPETTVLLCGV